MTLVILNVLFFLAGAGVLGGALFVRFQSNVVQEAADKAEIDIVATNLFTAAYVLMGFGGFTLLVSFCGCFGAIKESKV